MEDKNYKLYIVKDQFGNVDFAVCNEKSDTINTCNSFISSTDSKEDTHFESEAYHLESHCKQHGFYYKEYDKKVPNYLLHPKNNDSKLIKQDDKKKKSLEGVAHTLNKFF